MNPHYGFVAKRAGHRCEYCQAPEAVFNFPFEVEHVIPPGHGGQEEESNLALSCRACNLFKSNQVGAIDSQTKASAPLFHPRQHHWKEHFTVDEQSGAIKGKTAIGRATVEGLQMNRLAQLTARRNWILLRLWPAP